MNSKPDMDIQLTKYSHGAGCGCKISPAILDRILHTPHPANPAPGSPAPGKPYPRLLVGNDTRDDAAVWDLGNGDALISTTDFFMPIVDDPYDFGRIASANAISDVYAMGGKPVLAIAILGWPIDKLSPEVAAQVLEGARAICAEAGIPLAGGHSIDCPEPVFGLAVNGIVPIANIRKNSTAIAGSRLYLTKTLGVGILSTAQKKGILAPEDAAVALANMTTLNRLGERLGQIPGVTAMTDVTGFGLLGHLAEMCEGSNLSARIEFEKVPIIRSITAYLEKGCVPGGTLRNWASYGQKIKLAEHPKPQIGSHHGVETQRNILADPQTSGGLLIAVTPEATWEVEQILQSHNLPAECCRPFGILLPRDPKSPTLITIETQP